MSEQSQQSSAPEQVLQGEVKGIKKILPFLGPAFIAAVAYIDPGNFATNITAGSKYGYLLLWVIAISNLMALLIQSLSAKLGIATGKNLPELARENYRKGTSIFLWVQSELVIIATDLAEFIGAALGLNLLFGMSMIPAALITAAASFGILELQRRGYRPLEIGIACMVFIVVLAFVVQTIIVQPQWSNAFHGLFVPRLKGVNSILLAAGILGATVMPHAIYLHSSLTQSRIKAKNEEEKRRIFKFEFIDILIAMIIAGVINMLILVVSGTIFYEKGMLVQDLPVAYHKFFTYLGPVAAISFGLALLIAGLSSSSVGTLAGDVVMQGFINKRINLYVRRAITMIPPLLIIISGYDPTKALVLSQVVLSFGISFALVPLILFTSKENIMGTLVNQKWVTALGWIVAALVISLNIFLLFQSLFT
ncbi:Nramp family divalent metal transporter [Heyndrickxia acidicola]|uniref:Divalent metal cation transporter MntH n=1 Tax=Heyndrickxia acidicola TaxID=209389 RepID=A0ABU6MCK0_9BACI|nr:Nramp family divalent metal transporter [Heyndrickxia acidicola]MED1201741.1 Nramp family divalent metal transporter [Heyndrickxia acidicola]